MISSFPTAIFQPNLLTKTQCPSPYPCTRKLLAKTSHKIHTPTSSSSLKSQKQEMGTSETTKQLPIIDFSDLKRGSPRWESVKAQVREALQEYGCFETVCDDIPPHLRESMIEEMRRLFQLPLETKQRNQYDKASRGYLGQYTKFPIYESLAIRDVLTPGSIDNFTNLMWPQGNSNFSKSVQSFCEQMIKLESTMKMMVVESFGLEKYAAEVMDSNNCVFRVHRYDVPKNSENDLGLPTHTDKTLGSVLCINGVKGLEMMTKDGDWFDADPSPNSFIVIVGDFLHAWTNGRLYSPRHKVIMKGLLEERYSMGLFTYPKEGQIIKPPEEMVDAEHPLLYKPFDPRKFLDEFYFTEKGLMYEDALKAYCGAN